MKSDRYISVLQAARRCGVTSRTFKRWLAALGFVFPPKGPGRRTLLAPESAVEAAIQKHAGRYTWSELGK